MDSYAWTALQVPISLTAIYLQEMLQIRIGILKGFALSTQVPLIKKHLFCLQYFLDVALPSMLDYLTRNQCKVVMLDLKIKYRLILI